jgi:hypothetical protein
MEQAGNIALLAVCFRKIFVALIFNSEVEATPTHLLTRVTTWLLNIGRSLMEHDAKASAETAVAISG